MHRRFVVIAVTASLLGGATAAGASYAAVRSIQEPNANGVITSCYDTSSGKVRMVNASARCAAGEKKLTWQQRVQKPKVHLVGATGEPAYQNQWKPYNGPPFGNLSFYKDASGVVHLTGLACKSDDDIVCTSATLIGGSPTIFTLPPGFRPSSQQLFTSLSSGQGAYIHTRIDIDTSGNVFLVAPPNDGEDWVSFDGISFLAN